MKLPFEIKNVKDCICSMCPVQIRSTCAREKEKSSKGMSDPKPHDVSRLYCSSGKAACTDLDLKQMCICGSCPVWSRFKLVSSKPSLHFCRDGAAK